MKGCLVVNVMTVPSSGPSWKDRLGKCLFVTADERERVSMPLPTERLRKGETLCVKRSLHFVVSRHGFDLDLLCNNYC